MKFQIFFTKRDAFISNAISFFTQSPVSHVGIRYGDKIWEARGDKGKSKVMSGSWSEMLNDSDLTGVCVADLDVYSVQEALNWLNSKVDTPYDFFNTGVLQPFKLIFGRLVGQKKHSVADNKYQCAELGADFVKLKTRQTFKITKPIAGYSPAILFDIFQAKRVFSK